MARMRSRRTSQLLGDIQIMGDVLGIHNVQSDDSSGQFWAQLADLYSVRLTTRESLGANVQNSKTTPRLQTDRNHWFSDIQASSTRLLSSSFPHPR
jgi:hypothetical protein